jgi:hypothetical protein
MRGPSIAEIAIDIRTSDVREARSSGCSTS